MANTSRMTRMFPRGFVGSAPPPLVNRPERPFSNLIDSHSFHLNAFRMGANANTDNYEVEALYASYIKQDPGVTSVQFRERILKVALKAFGGDNFGNWVVEQYNCPAVGDMHRRFIDDTLKFISGGRREMNPMTWAELVVVTNGDKASKFSPQVLEFFGDSGFAANPFKYNQELIDVLQMWVKVPNGIEDLLLTLHVLFGNY